MNRIVVTDSATLNGPWEFVPNEAETNVRQKHIERMENAWRPDATAADASVDHRDTVTTADGSDVTGPERLTHFMTNAWRTPPRD